MNTWRFSPFGVGGEVLLPVLSFLFLTVLFFAALPATVHAAPRIEWGDVLYDENTGDLISDNRIFIEDGGVYQVPLGEAHNIAVSSTLGTGFDRYGEVYRVHDTGGN